MDLASARRIIEALADGVDPRTGEVLDPGSPIESAEVVRALHVALTAIDKRARRLERDPSLPTNAGKSWEAAEEQVVGDLFDAGRQVADIANALERTQGAIAARLVRLGKVPDRDSAFAANRPATGNGR